MNLQMLFFGGINSLRSFCHDIALSNSILWDKGAAFLFYFPYTDTHMHMYTQVHVGVPVHACTHTHTHIHAHTVVQNFFAL